MECNYCRLALHDSSTSPAPKLVIGSLKCMMRHLSQCEYAPKDLDLLSDIVEWINTSVSTDLPLVSNAPSTIMTHVSTDSPSIQIPDNFPTSTKTVSITCIDDSMVCSTNDNKLYENLNQKLTNNVQFEDEPIETNSPEMQIQETNNFLPQALWLL